MAPPKRTRDQAQRLSEPSGLTQASTTRLRRKESSDEEGQSDDSSEESGEESAESGEENAESGEEVVESGEESDGEATESSEEGEHSVGTDIKPATSAGNSAPASSARNVGSALASSAHRVGSAPASSAGPVAPLVPSIAILPATPVKNQGKSSHTMQVTPSDNQEDMFEDDLEDNQDHPDSPTVEHGLKRGRERSGTSESRVTKTHRRSTSHSTAPTVPSNDELDPRGASRTTGGFSRGRASNAGNWGDFNDDFLMDSAGGADSTYGKVLLYVNRDSGTPPYMSFTTATTSKLPVVLKELSGRFSPIERRNSRIYVHEDDMWEVKGRFSQAMKDNAPLQWEETDDGKFFLNLLAVSVFKEKILSTFKT